MSFRFINGPVNKINWAASGIDPNITLPDTRIISQSYLKNLLDVLLQLPTTVLNGESFVKNNLTLTVYLSNKLFADSYLLSGISKFIGALKLSVTLRPIPTTSYLKGVPRPIAYLSNDNDNYGSTTEIVKSSPNSTIDT